MHLHQAEQVHQFRTSGCLPIVLESGSQPARTLTAVMLGSSPSFMKKGTGRALPSSRPMRATPLRDGRSCVLLRQSKGSSKYGTCFVDSVNYLTISSNKSTNEEDLASSTTHIQRREERRGRFRQLAICRSFMNLHSRKHNRDALDRLYRSIPLYRNALSS